MKRWNRWQDWTSVLLGAWLFASPWLFAYADHAAGYNAWLFGAAISVASLWALAQPASRGAEAANMALATWVFFSPWFLYFATATSAAAWNAWIIGGVVAIDAVWGLTRSTPKVWHA